jgi:hypothetical protein
LLKSPNFHIFPQQTNIINEKLFENEKILKIKITWSSINNAHTREILANKDSSYLHSQLSFIVVVVMAWNNIVFYSEDCLYQQYLKFKSHTQTYKAIASARKCEEERIYLRFGIIFFHLPSFSSFSSLPTSQILH